MFLVDCFCSLMSLTLLWRFFLYKNILFGKISEEFYSYYRVIVSLKIYLFCFFHILCDICWFLSLVTLIISPRALYQTIKETWNVELNYESKPELEKSLNKKFEIVRKNREGLYDNIWSVVGYLTFGVFFQRYKLWSYLMKLYKNPQLNMNETPASSL